MVVWDTQANLELSQGRSSGRGWATVRKQGNISHFPSSSKVNDVGPRQYRRAMEIPAKLAVRPILRVTRQDGHLSHCLPNTRLPTLHLRTLRHATLPAERVSSENLIAFLNILPCPSRAGVAALLKPHKIFDADWHGLVVRVRRRAGVGIELVQPVLDPVRTLAEHQCVLTTCYRFQA
jgi:Gpi16 subunit, GPI transamidase component